MQIKKRDGRLVDFNPDKIKNAMLSAYHATQDNNNELDNFNKIIDKVIDSVNTQVELGNVLDVETIQDQIENALMSADFKNIAKAYITYRHDRTMARENPLDNEVMEMISGESEYWSTENSNKDAKVVSTMRDYVAGIVSTSLARRKMLPKEVVKAHDEGILHQHDNDYMLEPKTNCELINLDDMLQNGTVINKVKIEKPHRLLTATTIATQVILGVTSMTYGGCSVTLTHLAPFVRDSYNYYIKKYKEYGGLTEKQIKEFADKDTKKEIKDAMQTLIYQLNSMTNSNGQSPFITVFMYLNENLEYKKEVAMLTEEVIRQRIQGMKNEQGVWVSPAFPKLIYVLEEDNIKEGTEYWYLTELAAQCSAKRLVPDYISEKNMKAFKDGACFPPMG